jgi:hypothetical protein
VTRPTGVFLVLLRGRSYLGAAACALWGCAAPGRAAPEAAGFTEAPRQALEAAAARTVPAARELLRIRWRSDDGRVSASGSGALRVAPPDSMRVDVAVRLGVARATLIVAGERVEAEPVEAARALLPDRFALWAAIGVVRLPDGGASVERFDDGTRTFWRVSDGAGRRTTFEMAGDTLRGVTRDSGGPIQVRLVLTRGADGRVRKAQVFDFERGARFEVNITERRYGEVFPSAVWQLRP